MQNSTEIGLDFILPEAIIDKAVSVVEVGPFDETGLAAEINRFLNTDIKVMTRINTYLLVHPLDLRLNSLLVEKPFVDPIIYRASLNKPLIYELGIDFDFVLQSMLNLGTSDAEGDVALRQTLLALGRQFTNGDRGFYSKQHFLKGELNIGQLEEVCAFLANPKLNTNLILSKFDYDAGKKVYVPIVTLPSEIKVQKYDVTVMSDEELIQLSDTRKLAANLEEMKHFAEMYSDEEFISKRKTAGLDEQATDVELETWFGLRSEHCFHKEFNAHITLEDRADDAVFKKAFEKGWLGKDAGRNYTVEKGIFKTFIQEPAEIIYERLEKRGKNWIVKPMFSDNAGTLYYDENYMFCIKYETHNSPSNIEPIQGAKTGIDGVNRDIFANMLGTFEAIANFFLYCTGDPGYRGWLPKGVKHPYALLKGITQGVREGGNESQIPTLGGGLITDPRFIAKILVYCGTVGFSPVRSPDGKSYIGKHPETGDLVFVVGQPVGIDGVHGATESSLSASERISLGHVQADFSFVQTKWKEWSLSCARDLLFNSVGDCGAMGIGAALELAEQKGLILNLDKHPRKYVGIQPWQVACSETQDREIPVVTPKNKDEILSRANLYDVEVSELGAITDTGYAELRWDNKCVGLIDLKKLADKEPRKRMKAAWNGLLPIESLQVKGNYSLEESLCLVMEQPDVSSKEWFFRQKDSSVKGGTIQWPLIGLKREVESDATIQKPLETEGKDKGALAYALGIAPKLSDIDPYLSAQKSFIDMAGKIIAIGGALPDMKNPKWDAWAACGNYCQPNSDSKTTLKKESGEHNLASLLRETIAVREIEEITNIPIISGKDSMKCSCIYQVDETFNLEDVPADLREHINLVKDSTGKRKIEIHDPDSYLTSCAVKIEDYRKCVSADFKQDGDLIYVIGTTKNHLGASQFANAIGYKEQGKPLKGGKGAEVNFDEFIKVADALHQAIDSELVASCKYVGDGGLVTALSKCAISGEVGASISVEKIIANNTFDNSTGIFYSETPGRFIVTVAPEDQDEFEGIIASVPYGRIGIVTMEQRIDVNHFRGVREEIDLINVKSHYQKPLSFGLQEMKSSG